MANGLNRLTARRVDGHKTPGLRSDGGGLYLKTRASASRDGRQSYSKAWVFVFFLPKRREMGLGSTKVVDLAEARRLATLNRKLVAAGVDPIAERRQAPKRRTEAENPSPVFRFGTFADAYVAGLGHSPKTVRNWRRTVEVHCLPIRDVALAEVGLDEVVAVIRPLMKSMPVSGDKALTYIRKILASARVQGLRSGDNPAVWKDNLDQIILDRAQPLSARGHHMALPYREMPVFMAGLKLREGCGARALEFLILTAMRATEVCGAQWSEIDRDAHVWNVPAARMKMGVKHRVALSQDAVTLLQALERKGDFLFPGLVSRDHIDAMTLTRVLKRMGVKDRSTVHGFRSTFRDWVGEATEFDATVAEHALAHKVGTEVERAYLRGDALEKRFALMDAWPTFALEGLTRV